MENLLNWLSVLCVFLTGYWYWEYNQYQNNLYDNASDVILILPYAELTYTSDDATILKFEYHTNQSDYIRFGDYQTITIVIDNNQNVVIAEYQQNLNSYYETINLDFNDRQFLLLENERKQLLGKIMASTLLKLEHLP